METWDAIRARRDIRRYTGEAIDRDDLERILEAGRRAPSSRNWQPWDFVVVTGRERLHGLSKVWRGAGHVADSAATIALIAPLPADERHRNWVQYDLGQATMSMLLAATDLGLGSAHAAVSDQSLARELLGFPEERFCAYLLAFGHPGDRALVPVREPDRRPFGDVVHWDRW
ncbi:nitroreductase family protein [Qaidamihabitans albus]|uniref:nitroreductase family protein n=1 Tax=Qaidamihabitans albus TaxID=2795733 RepID=UPI0018F19C00|nr:nitroreductase family protein [Qaidamihabitans albus]